MFVKQGEVHVYVVDIEKHRVYREKYERLLSWGERRQLKKLKTDAARQRFCIMQGVLRVALSQYLNVFPRGIRFSFGVHGKPRVAGDVQFSMAASGGMGIIAIGKRSVGVDIERLSVERMKRMNLAQRLTEKEKIYARTLSEERRLRSYFQAIVRKSALLKAKGNRMALRSHEIETNLKQRVFVTQSSGNPWYTYDVLLDDRSYVAGLTFRTKSENEEVVVMNNPVETLFMKSGVIHSMAY